MFCDKKREKTHIWNSHTEKKNTVSRCVFLVYVFYADISFLSLIEYSVILLRGFLRSLVVTQISLRTSHCVGEMSVSKTVVRNLLYLVLTYFLIKMYNLKCVFIKPLQRLSDITSTYKIYVEGSLRFPFLQLVKPILVHCIPVKKNTTL